MRVVQPIRDYDKLEAIKQDLRENNERDYILFLIGTNVGPRISDILPLQVHHVKGTHIPITEKKTGKQKLIKINHNLRKELDRYIAGKSDNEYLFPARSKKQKSGLKRQPIDRSTAYKMLNKVARRFGLTDIGCHTMRKTFGYHFYRSTGDIALLMDLFNHSHQTITLRYIGIKQDTMDDALDRFSL